jgi:hypothetical protein
VCSSDLEGMGIEPVTRNESNPLRELYTLNELG